jgi:glycosyltransferase involved in cell wall biosynthesis
MAVLKVSIFTATHNTQYLLELYSSLKSQSYDEWVIYVNGEAKIEDVPTEIKVDPRTKFVATEGFEPKRTNALPNIGSIKKHVCKHCTGDILLEMDHDDLLVEGAVDKIRTAFENPDIVFVFGNSAAFNNNDNSPRFYGNATAETNYDSLYNWQYRDFNYKGVLYKEAITPPLNPFHTSLVLFQPDHPRAFRRTTYEKVGGHDEDLFVCDDQDLICKFYLEGKFHHIDECLYLYRVFGTNSWLDRNYEIQVGMFEVQKKHIYQMIITEGKRNGLKMIDIGGRFNSPEEFTSVDLKDADINVDLNDDWPFEDSSVYCIRAFDIIEHLSDIMHTMSEIHRVLMPGGYALIRVPSTDGRGAFQDPTHRTFFNINSFWYYTDRETARYIDNTTIRFKAATLFQYFPGPWWEEHNIPYVSTILMCLKDNFRPHGLELI